MKPQAQQQVSINNQKGVHPPLFDCLKLEGPQKILLDLEGLQTSIAQEIDLILNTRPVSKKTVSDFEDKETDLYQIQYFGLQDFALQQATSRLGQRQMIAEITRVIEAYEPRLKNVQIQINLSNENKQSVSLIISGEIQYGHIKANTTFPIFIKNLLTDKSDHQTKL